MKMPSPSIPRALLPFFVMLLATIAGCADFSSAGPWVSKGDEELQNGRCDKAIDSYVHAVERAVPSEDPPRDEDSGTLRSTLGKIKQLSSTCMARDDYPINSVGALINTLTATRLNSRVSKEKYKAEATDMAYSFLVFAERNPAVMFEHEYGVSHVLGWANETSDAAMQQRAAKLWLERSSWQPRSASIAAGLRNSSVKLDEGTMQAIEARVALTTELAKRADAATEGRCHDGGLCKGGYGEGDPEFIAFSRNYRDWYRAYAALLAKNGFPAPMIALVQSMAAKQDQFLSEKLARLNAPPPAPASDDGYNPILGAIGAAMQVAGTAGRGSSAASMQNLGRQITTASSSQATADAMSMQATQQVLAGAATRNNASQRGAYAAAQPAAMASAAKTSAPVQGCVGQAIVTRNMYAGPEVAIVNQCAFPIRVSWCVVGAHDGTKAASNLTAECSRQYAGMYELQPGEKQSLQVAGFQTLHSISCKSPYQVRQPVWRGDDFDGQCLYGP
ncbi:hypothetical protein [Achromobacter aloeverae]|uniref:Lipoprotein n=1 Tax=Achromobacter aloeverae TaxID=1750518 RepID=A0A4Q1HKI3_9BURK|nr:hypothetical protein [Achromobacter aloeverae]RXN90459.1 hypothetical protein C7R54_13245 [Achromobacter aloeverae]